MRPLFRALHVRPPELRLRPTASIFGQEEVVLRRADANKEESHNVRVQAKLLSISGKSLRLPSPVIFRPVWSCYTLSLMS